MARDPSRERQARCHDGACGQQRVVEAAEPHADYQHHGQRQRAREIGGTSLVLTFDPHPLKILAPERCPVLITPTAKKLSIIQECRLDAIICLPFTQALADLTPVAFVEEVLVGTIGIREIYVG